MTAPLSIGVVRFQLFSPAQKPISPPPVFVHKDTLRPNIDSDQAVEIAPSPVRVYPRSVISEATDTNFLPSQASSSFFVSRFSLGSCDQLKQFAVTGSRVHNTIY